jgi:hypothetical protein
MRFSLRTLIVVMLISGPMLAAAWWAIANPEKAIAVAVAFTVPYAMVRMLIGYKD